MISNTDLNGATAFAPNVVGAGDRPSALHFELAHHLPGRLRLRSALLKANADASEQTQHDLAEIDGVRSASANPITGSVLLEYDPETIPPTQIINVLILHGYSVGGGEANIEAEIGWADKLASAVKDRLISALAERIALAVITTLA